MNFDELERTAARHMRAQIDQAVSDDFALAGERRSIRSLSVGLAIVTLSVAMLVVVQLTRSGAPVVVTEPPAADTTIATDPSPASDTLAAILPDGTPITITAPRTLMLGSWEVRGSVAARIDEGVNAGCGVRLELRPNDRPGLPLGAVIETFEGRPGVQVTLRDSLDQDLATSFLVFTSERWLMALAISVGDACPATEMTPQWATHLSLVTDAAGIAHVQVDAPASIDSRSGGGPSIVFRNATDQSIAVARRSCLVDQPLSEIAESFIASTCDDSGSLVAQFRGPRDFVENASTAVTVSSP